MNLTDLNHSHCLLKDPGYHPTSVTCPSYSFNFLSTMPLFYLSLTLL